MHSVPTHAALKQYNREHVTTTVVAARHGVSRKTAARWFTAAGLSRPTRWDLRKGAAAPPRPAPADLRSAYADGASLGDLAARYGVSTTLVVDWCKEDGLERRPSGFAGGRRWPGLDGHSLRSSYEVRVCTWLHEHQVEHDVEPPLGVRRLAGDFLTATGWYIEVWGVQRVARYDERRQEKQALYLARGLPLVSLEDYHFAPSRHGLWERRLAPVLSNAH